MPLLPFLRRIAGGREASRLKHIQHTIDTLYGGVSGYSLSFADRTGPLESNKALTYGEMLLPSLSKVMAPVQPKPGDVFYDLGSGMGKLVMMAHLLHPFSRCVGIELLPTLHAQAKAALEQYERDIRPALPKAEGEIEFIQGDLFAQDVSQADVIFTYPVCFPDELKLRLEELFRTCKDGARIIAAGGVFYSPWLEYTHGIEYPTAWDTTATCYLYRKI